MSIDQWGYKKKVLNLAKLKKKKKKTYKTETDTIK